MKSAFFLMAFSLLAIACSGGGIKTPVSPPLEEATAGVKSKTYYPSLESNQILTVEDFEYGNQGKLLKKTYYSGNRETISHYELSSYDGEGRLRYRLNYHGNVVSPTGFILLDSTAFSYSGSFLVLEKTIYPYANYYVKSAYKYAGVYLTRKTNYYNEDLELYTDYEYKNGGLLRETDYYKDGSLIESREYRYEGNAPVVLIYYTFRNEAKRRISYSYDGVGRLILEKVDELFPFSSSLPYVVRYQY